MNIKGINAKSEILKRNERSKGELPLPSFPLPLPSTFRCGEYYFATKKKKKPPSRFQDQLFANRCWEKSYCSKLRANRIPS